MMRSEIFQKVSDESPVYLSDIVRERANLMIDKVIWIEREYETWLTPHQYLDLEKQIKNQDNQYIQEDEDRIIVGVEYDWEMGVAKIIAKFRYPQ